MVLIVCASRSRLLSLFLILGAAMTSYFNGISEARNIYSGIPQRAPSFNHHHPPVLENKWIPLVAVSPGVMQRVSRTGENIPLRRFMWKEMDATVDHIIHGVASGAQAMNQMISGPFYPSPDVIRFKKPNDFLPLPSTNFRYIIKSPVRPKRIIRLPPAQPPKFIAAPISTTSVSKPIIEITTQRPTFAPFLPTRNAEVILDDYKYLDDHTLRELEKKEEEKAEATISSFLPNVFFEEVITGKPMGEWTPVTAQGVSIYGPTTLKPYHVSELHTSVINCTNENDIEIEEPTTSHHSYEVTEHSAEETIQRPFSFRPSKPRFFKERKYSTTTKRPNSIEENITSKSKTTNYKDESTTENVPKKSSFKMKLFNKNKYTRSPPVNAKKISVLHIETTPKFETSTTSPTTTTTRYETSTPTSTKLVFTPTARKQERVNRTAQKEISVASSATTNYSQASQSSRGRGSVKFGNKA